MLINLMVGSKESHFLADPPDEFDKSATPKGVAGDATAILPSPFTLECPPPPPLPPPPPPPPPNAPPPPGTCIFQKFGARRRSKLRNFNWDAIPQERVKGRHSLWNAEHCEEDLQIDTGRIEELFARREEESAGRQGSWRGQRTRSLAEPQAHKVSLLDAKRCMNIGIFLKQFKRSAPEIVEDIKQGDGERYCGEKLAELMKHLPEKEEVKRLKSFSGDHSNLGEAELFLLLLLEVPSYTLRLEALILKKEFPATVLSLLSSARVLQASAQELLCCSELHMILRLVLKAGNFMNAGGYAGNAAGFHISSLLKLADTKSNKPGTNLLHFVAMEVQQRYPDLLSFPDRLEHIGGGSRLSEGGLLEEFSRLRGRVSSLCHTLDAAEQKELRDQMAAFLQNAQDQLREVLREIEALQSSRQQLLEFLCEEEESFKLEECCQVFSSFCSKFLRAVQENKDRELEERRRQESERERLEKRRSTATCSAMEDHVGGDELALTLERNLRSACGFRSMRRAKARSAGAARLAYFSCQGPWVRRVRDQDIEALSDEENARQLREVSETVLNQQMGYNISPDKHVRSRPEIANCLSQSVLEKSESSKEPQLDIPSFTVSDLARVAVSSQPSPGHIHTRPEISSQTLTKNVSERPDISCQPTAGPPLAISVVNGHPSTLNMPARPKISSHPSTRNIPAKPEVNNQPSTGNVPTKPEVSNQPSTGNVPTRPEVNNQLSTGIIPARPEVSNQPPTENVPTRPEVNNQPSAGNVQSKPDIKSQPSAGPIQEKLEISRKSSSGTVDTRPEVNVTLSTGPSLTEFPRVGETVECQTLVKGLKSHENPSVQKAPPSPCAKWKREQLHIWESGEGEQSSPPRMPERMRAQVYLDRNQRGKDSHKESEPGGHRGNGAGTVKRSEVEVSVRRVHSAKERSSVPAGTRDAKGLKPSSCPGDQLPSPPVTKPSSLIRRTTLPRSIQSKASAAMISEGWKGGSSRVRKETQNPASGNVRELDKDRGPSSTLRTAVTSPRKLISRTDSMKHLRDATTSPVTQKGPTSPRPESLQPHQSQTSHRVESVQPQRGNATSSVAQGGPTSPKTTLGTTKKPRVVTPVTAKVVKHCDPTSPSSASEAGRSRRSGSQPVWR